MISGDPIRTIPPTALPVSLSEFKAHARVDDDDEDAIMVAYLRAAVEMVEQYTSLSLITSTWEQTFSEWPTATEPDFILWRRPLQSVVSVEYLDSGSSPAGIAAIADPSVYRVIGVGAQWMPGRLRLATGGTWPTLYTDPQAITVTYRSGFGNDHNSVPELIRHAVLMAAATLFAFREDLVMGSAVAELPMASKALLRDWRPLAVA